MSVCELERIALLLIFTERPLTRACLIETRGAREGGADHHVESGGVHARALCLAF